MDQPSDQIVSGYIEGTLSLIGCKMAPITMMQDQSVIIVQFFLNQFFQFFNLIERKLFIKIV